MAETGSQHSTLDSGGNSTKEKRNKVEVVDMSTGEIIDAEVASTETSAVQRYEQPDSLAITRDPKDVLADAQKAAKALMEVVGSKKKQVAFNGETYLESGDWQTVAKFYGVTAKVESTNFVDYGGVQGFEASAVALDRNGQVVSRGESMCMRDEENWGSRPKYEWQDILDTNGKKIWDQALRQGKGAYKQRKVQVGSTPVPLFQLRSMAQTRACAKALSNVFKWVVVLAGYKPTPAEEMDGVFQHPPDNEPVTPASVMQQNSSAIPTTPVASGATQSDSENASVGSTEPDIKPRSQRTIQPSTQPTEAPQQASQTQGEVVQGEPVITEKQRKMLFAIQKSIGLSNDDVKDEMNRIGLTCHRDEISKHRFQDVLDAIDPDMKYHQNKN